VAALALMATYLSVYISPAKFWIFAFIGMGYPFILIINVLFVLFWIIFRKWYVFISIVAIAIGWNILREYFQFQPRVKDPVIREKQIRLLTFNVRLFNYYLWEKDTATWSKIIRYIHQENPDIVCFQEFITVPNSKHSLENLKRKMAPLSYSHIYYTDQVPGKINFGMATFSKFEMVHKKRIEFKHSLNGSIATDLVLGTGDTIRLFNCHLQSMRLRHDYNDVLDSVIFSYSEKQLNNLKDLSLKMKQAFIKRASQVDILAGEIRSSPYPVVICGDFNDTPVSYAYHKIGKNLEDAFIEAGKGTGNTFRGNLPYVRIDYVFYNGPLHAGRYSTKKMQLSDHYPVTVDFTIHEKADSTGHNSRRK
jgi:endonuclease/exonuclease/phosphatase family metal-dependent hydrolase